MATAGSRKLPCRRDVIEMALEAYFAGEFPAIETDEPYALNRNGRPLQGSYNIDKELHKRFKAEAVRRNMHLSDLINAIIVDYEAQKV